MFQLFLTHEPSKKLWKSLDTSSEGSNFPESCRVSRLFRDSGQIHSERVKDVRENANAWALSAFPAFDVAEKSLRYSSGVGQLNLCETLVGPCSPNHYSNFDPSWIPSNRKFSTLYGVV
jgi:hypothetical protein